MGTYLPLTTHSKLPNNHAAQRVFSTTTITMSGFSNTDTGSKTADPYTQKNLEEPSLKEKCEDLLNFVDKTKFCLLTTQAADSDLLASRAMAVAAKEGHGFDFLFHTNTESGKTDDLKEQVRQRRLHQQLRRMGLHLRPRLHRDRP